MGYLRYLPCKKDYLNAIISLKVGDTSGTKYGGDNAIIDTEEELNHFRQFFSEIIKIKSEFNNIMYFETINEPNIYTKYHGVYYTNEELNWFSKMIKSIYNDGGKEKDNIVIGELANEQKDAENRLNAEKFFDTISQNGVNKFAKKYSVHIYDSSDMRVQDMVFSSSLEKYKKQFNSFGGFIKLFVTEYGLATYDANKLREEVQANRLVQETITLDKYNVRLFLPI